MTRKLPLRYKDATLDKIDKKIPVDLSLFIYGDSGTGKTFIAAALCNNDLATGHLNREFITTTDLILELQNTFNSKDESLFNVINKYATIDNLYLDDFGSEKLTDWVLYALYSIINARYSDMLRTIITSNVDLGTIAENYGDRIVDRINSMCKVIRLKPTERPRDNDEHIKRRKTEKVVEKTYYDED